MLWEGEEFLSSHRYIVIEQLELLDFVDHCWQS